MARQNESNIVARVLDLEVFDSLQRGISRYATECREDFCYPDKLISEVNDDLNDAKYTLEAELSKARQKRIDAYYALEAAKDCCEYDDEGNCYTPDYSYELSEYNAALQEEEWVKQKIEELKEIRKYYNEVEAEYKNNKIIFENYLNRDMEDASNWMKEEYKLMKDYIWQGKQLK